MNPQYNGKGGVRSGSIFLFKIAGHVAQFHNVHIPSRANMSKYAIA